MEPENPYETPQHPPSPPPRPEDEWSSADFRKRRRFWLWMSLAPASLSLLAVILSPIESLKETVLALMFHPLWIVPLWLILCAIMVPPPRHLMRTAAGAFWKIGWYFLFIIVHLIILYAAISAGCSLMPPSKGGWHQTG